MLNYSELRMRFDEYFEKNLDFPMHPAGLYEPCYYILEDRGKRIRPALCLLAAQLFGAGIAEDAYRTAMALELFHNFTLIHDDIMDNAPLRRGKPTIHEHYGSTTAILSGDVMNIFSYKCLCEIDLAYIKTILHLFNTTAMEVCEGQQLDMDYEQAADVTIPQYLEMIRLKTSVLLACSLKSGAIIGGANAEDAEQMYELGINLGMAFQLQDDYLDTFGLEQEIGKKVGGDILAQKNTYLQLIARESASLEQLDRLKRLQHFPDKEKIAATISHFHELEVNIATEELVKSYFGQSLANLESIHKSAEEKQPLLDLVNRLILRNK